MKLQKYKHTSPVSYALGATLVAELLETHPELITRAFLRPTGKHGINLDKILDSLKQRNIEIVESTKAFNILDAKDNCFLIAEFTKPANRQNENAPSIILVNPSDTGNLGTIMRSAVAFDYQNLTIVTPAVDPYDPKVVRASMGAVFHLNIQTANSYDRLDLSSNSYAFILNPEASELSSVKPTQKPTLIFGNEAAGLPSDFVAKTGATPIFIKQSQYVDSLNLAVAASIAMHYFAN